MTPDPPSSLTLMLPNRVSQLSTDPGFSKANEIRRQTLEGPYLALTIAEGQILCMSSGVQLRKIEKGLSPKDWPPRHKFHEDYTRSWLGETVRSTGGELSTLGGYHYHRSLKHDVRSLDILTVCLENISSFCRHTKRWCFHSFTTYQGLRSHWVQYLLSIFISEETDIQKVKWFAQGHKWPCDISDSTRISTWILWCQIHGSTVSLFGTTTMGIIKMVIKLFTLESSHFSHLLLQKIHSDSKHDSSTSYITNTEGIYSNKTAHWPWIPKVNASRQ